MYTPEGNQRTKREHEIKGKRVTQERKRYFKHQQDYLGVETQEMGEALNEICM